MVLKSKTLQKSVLLRSKLVNSMQIVVSFGKNVFVGERMVGYIDREGIFINRQKFADITPEGEISFGAKKLGYVDDDGYIIIKDKEVGYIDNDNNFVFYDIKF